MHPGLGWSRGLGGKEEEGKREKDGGRKGDQSRDEDGTCVCVTPSGLPHTCVGSVAAMRA